MTAASGRRCRRCAGRSRLQRPHQAKSGAVPGRSWARKRVFEFPILLGRVLAPALLPLTQRLIVSDLAEPLQRLGPVEGAQHAQAAGPLRPGDLAQPARSGATGHQGAARARRGLPGGLRHLGQHCTTVRRTRGCGWATWRSTTPKTLQRRSSICCSPRGRCGNCRAASAWASAPTMTNPLTRAESKHHGQRSPRRLHPFVAPARPAH